MSYTISIEPSRAPGKVTAHSSDGHAFTTSTPLLAGARYWQQPAHTNPDSKYARERLPRHDIAVTNCEAGDEGEIQRITHRPALDKANQQAKGHLNRQNHRKDRPREMKGVADRHLPFNDNSLGLKMRPSARQTNSN